MTSEKIITLLPYSEPFLFVDSITDVNENRIVGNYTFKKNAYFYKGHFKNNPVTPGVILIETMAQIGLVSFGIYLIGDGITKYKDAQIAMVSIQVDFFIPVFPGETVTVNSQKIYFRFGKLKCSVDMKNSKDELVSKGLISGMIKIGADGK
jgi:3-hydroxyacyl-[acyl-carrier-protein] dehydratase